MIVVSETTQNVSKRTLWVHLVLKKIRKVCSLTYTGIVGTASTSITINLAEKMKFKNWQRWMRFSVETGLYILKPLITTICTWFLESYFDQVLYKINWMKIMLQGVDVQVCVINLSERFNFYAHGSAVHINAWALVVLSPESTPILVYWSLQLPCSLNYFWAKVLSFPKFLILEYWIFFSFSPSPYRY